MGCQGKASNDSFNLSDVWDSPLALICLSESSLIPISDALAKKRHGILKYTRFLASKIFKIVTKPNFPSNWRFVLIVVSNY